MKLTGIRTVCACVTVCVCVCEHDAVCAAVCVCIVGTWGWWGCHLVLELGPIKQMKFSSQQTAYRVLIRPEEGRTCLGCMSMYGRAACLDEYLQTEAQDAIITSSITTITTTGSRRSRKKLDPVRFFVGLFP